MGDLLKMCKKCSYGDKTKETPGFFKRAEAALFRFMAVPQKTEDTQLCEQQNQTEESENIREVIRAGKENPADRIEPWKCMYCGYENPKGILWCKECGFLGGIKD